MQGSITEILSTMFQLSLVLLLVSAVLAGHGLAPLNFFKRITMTGLATALLVPWSSSLAWVNYLLLLLAVAAVTTHVIAAKNLNNSAPVLK